MACLRMRSEGLARVGRNRWNADGSSHFQICVYLGSSVAHFSYFCFVGKLASRVSEDRLVSLGIGCRTHLGHRSQRPCKLPDRDAASPDLQRLALKFLRIEVRFVRGTVGRGLNRRSLSNSTGLIIVHAPALWDRFTSMPAISSMKVTIAEWSRSPLPSFISDISIC